MSSLCSRGWLPAIALFIAVPALPQAALSYSSAGSTPAPADTGMLRDRSAARPQISKEELGHLMMYRRRYQTAIQAFMQIPAPSALVWNQMGIAYEMLFDYKDAMRCYSESLKINPRDPVVLNNLATAQDGTKQFSSAERTYRKSLKLEPNPALTLKNLGTNLLMQHKYKNGSAAYSQALSLDSHILDAHSGAKLDAPAPPLERATAAYFKARSCALAGLNDCAITFFA